MKLESSRIVFKLRRYRLLNNLRAINPNATSGYEDESFTPEELVNLENYSEHEPGHDLNDEEMMIMEKAAHGALEDEDEEAILQDVLERVLEEPEFSPGHDVAANDIEEDGSIQFYDEFATNPSLLLVVLMYSRWRL